MKATPLDTIMQEPVSVPGAPFVIVTRQVLHQWLVSLGMDQSAKGFGSVDYLTFGRPASTEPLTGSAERDLILEMIRETNINQ